LFTGSAPPGKYLLSRVEERGRHRAGMFTAAAEHADEFLNARFTTHRE
jgi:hypothetical protein